MNHAQRLLVIATLLGLGLVLMVTMLHLGISGGSEILPIMEVPDPRYPSQPDTWAIRTRGNIAVVPGVLLGIVAPLCLFALAAYVALGEGYLISALRGWSDQPEETLKRAQDLATTAIAASARWECRNGSSAARFWMPEETDTATVST